jgi:hypothetical protein
MKMKQYEMDDVCLKSMLLNEKNSPLLGLKTTKKQNKIKLIIFKILPGADQKKNSCTSVVIRRPKEERPK